MADIFREVEEEVRKDRLLKLWKKYGSYVIIACFALVAGVAVSVAWREYQESQRLAEAERFIAAVDLLQQGETQAAAEAFEALGEEADSGYAVVARLREAAARAESGDREGALAVYDRIAGEQEFPQIYRDLASLLGAMLIADSAPAAEIEQRLAALLQPTSPWRFSAHELVALAAYREGRLEQARQGFEKLASDTSAPAGVRARSRQMLNAIGPVG